MAVAHSDLVVVVRSGGKPPVPHCNGTATVTVGALGPLILFIHRPCSVCVPLANQQQCQQIVVPSSDVAEVIFTVHGTPTHVQCIADATGVVVP